MVEPGDPPSAQEVADEEASEVEQEAAPVEREPPQEEGGDVEVSSAPAEMEVVEGDAMEVSPEPAVAVGESELEGRPGEEEEVSSPVVPQGERKQETAAATPVPAVEEKKHKDQENKHKERKGRRRERGWMKWAT